MGKRFSGGLIDIVLAATSTTLLTKGTGQSTAKKTVIKKIMFNNRSGGNSILMIGYTTLGGVFTQVLPDIQMLNGAHDIITEDQIPVCGNTPEGFMPDATAGTGSLGHIIGRASVAGAVIGAGGSSVQVEIEVEEDPEEA